MKSSPNLDDAPDRAAHAPSWSVGDLAGRFGLATHVLRYWEDEGLLTPQRDGGGRRRYGPDHLFRVAVILRNKAAGMSLTQIRVLLDASADDREAVLSAHVADLEQRMADMRRSREMTLHALRCQAHDIATCPRFKAAVQDLVDGASTAALPLA